MKRYIALALLAAIILSIFSGCGFWMDGEYEFEEPYNVEKSDTTQDAIVVSSFMQMRSAMVNLVETGATNGIFDISNFKGGSVRFFLDASIRYVKNSNPMGAYAVDTIKYEIGTNTGEQAVAISIIYRYDRTQIMKIVRSYSMEDAGQSLLTALKTFSERSVLRISKYKELDFQQWVYNYAVEHPDEIIEIPTIKTEIYPQKGSDRIICFEFTYSENLDRLRQMQADVKAVLGKTILDTDQELTKRESYSIIYDFLTAGGVYVLDETNTPAYSVLVNKTGDRASFAGVYALLCKKYNLECYVISGTYEDLPWSWNMVRIGDRYYHLDLLRCYQNRYFELLSDSDMTGYIWDFDAYKNN